MGFTEERVRRALLMSHNDLNNATNFLLQESLWRATVDYQCATDLNQRQMFTKNILVKSCNCFVWEGWRYLKVTYNVYMYKKSYYPSTVKCTGTYNAHVKINLHVLSQSNLQWNIHILFNHVCKEKVIFGQCLVKLLSP